MLEWVAISFSRGSSWPRDRTCISCIGRRWIFYHCATWEPWSPSKGLYIYRWTTLFPCSSVLHTDTGIILHILFNGLPLPAEYGAKLFKCIRNPPQSPWYSHLWFFIVLLHQLILHQVSVQSHYLHEGASLVAQLVKILLQCRRPRFDSWVGKIPWRRKWQPTSVFLPGESRGQRSLTGYSPWGHKSQTWLSN